jgi:hypothetical protein
MPQVNEIWSFKKQQEKVADQKSVGLSAATRAKLEKEKEARFKLAQAKAEAADRGSSHAYDKETGSIHRKNMQWDPINKKWAFM